MKTFRILTRSWLILVAVCYIFKFIPESLDPIGAIFGMIVSLGAWYLILKLLTWIIIRIHIISKGRINNVSFEKSK